MSSSRNKRKRTDGDHPSTTAAAPATTTAASRRRSREARSLGAEPTDSAAAKNEAGGSATASSKNSSNNATNSPADVANASSAGAPNPAAAAAATATTTGESSATGKPDGTTTAPQHAQAMTTTTAQAAQETVEEKKRESEPNAGPPSSLGVENRTTTAFPAMAGSSSENVKRAATPQTVASATSTSTNSAGLQVPASETLAAPLSSADFAIDSNKAQGQLANKSNSRESKIQSMIAHRKVLLERVNSGRSAARSRIVDVARREAQTASRTKQILASTGGDPSKGNTAGLSEKARDEAEIAAFKKLTKTALQAAKKQRAENNTDGSGHGEKRSSVSLRKGASVGKNMKAALSSLIPGGAGSSSVPLATAFSSQPLHAGATTGEALLQAQRSTASGLSRIPGQLPLPTKKQKSSSGSQIQQAAAAKQLRVPSGTNVDAMPKVARTTSQKNLKASANAVTSQSTSYSSIAVHSIPKPHKNQHS